MTNVYGIKIAKPGKSVHSADLRDLSVDLNTFSMFKLHSSSTTSVTLNGGDTEKSATIAHNLGYVPAFLVYYKRSDESVERLLPDIPYGVGFDFYPWAYATTTGITVGYSAKDPYNYQEFTVNNGYTSWGTNAVIAVGKYDGNGWNCGYIFKNITVNKNASIASAGIDYRVDTKEGSQDIKVKTWGLDEGSPPDFGSDLGRTKTDAYVEQNISAGSGSYVGINVKSIVEEITSRNDWVSGNSMGFYSFDNGTTDGNYISDGLGMGNDTILKITLSGSLTISFRVIIFKDKISD